MFYIWYKIPEHFWCYLVFDTKEDRVAGLKNILGMIMAYALGEGPAVDRDTCSFIGKPPPGIPIRRGRRSRVSVTLSKRED